VIQKAHVRRTSTRSLDELVKTRGVLAAVTWAISFQYITGVPTSRYQSSHHQHASSARLAGSGQTMHFELHQPSGAKPIVSRSRSASALISRSSTMIADAGVPICVAGQYAPRPARPPTPPGGTRPDTDPLRALGMRSPRQGATCPVCGGNSSHADQALDVEFH
jgi:hypothetical protein